LIPFAPLAAGDAEEVAPVVVVGALVSGAVGVHAATILVAAAREPYWINRRRVIAFKASFDLLIFFISGNTPKLF
jgi:hypothetical protein